MSDEYKYWLAFDSLCGVGLGTRRIQAIYKHFGSLKTAWEADRLDFNGLSGVPENAIHDFLTVRPNISLEKALSKLDKHNIRAYPQTDPLYPRQLLALHVPPLVIYAKGEWDLSWFDKSIGIVGTREASEYALSQTKDISIKMSTLGFAIISGLALGIDSAAHLGALQVPDGRTVAVLANGVDRAIPHNSKPIYESIVEKGIVLSEYPPETIPEKGFFPARNRIIAALSQSVLVCEAGEQSGALITAERAVELNRKVFGLVGPVNNKNMEGIHKWIRKGRAGLITSAEDILEDLSMEPALNLLLPTISEYKVPTKTRRTVSHASKLEVKTTKASIIIPKPLPELNQVETTVYSCLTQSSMSVDKLIENTGLPVSKVNSVLLTLQLKKLITRDFFGAVCIAG
jgi:DNA processing protein